MGNFFDRMTDVLDTQLRNQVDVLWPREAECLERHGLRAARTVLDLGTGNGYFLCRMAEHYPEKRFVGIDASEPLITKARELIARAGLHNVEVREACCPHMNVEGEFDFILARLSLYSMPHREDVLRWSCERLTAGGRMAVIDVDDGLSYAHPPDETWLHPFRVIEKVLGAAGADRHIGRKLPHLLLKAGFHDIRFDLRPWYSSLELSPDAFVEYWSGTATSIHAIAPDIFTSAHLKEYTQFLERVVRSKDQTAMCVMCVASGEK